METVIGVFQERSNAERAVEEIREKGFGEEDISILAREDRLKENGEEGDREGVINQDLTTGVTTGGVLGGLTGLLAGAGALTIPGVGPILAVGPIAAGLTGLAAGGIVGSLVDLGIPRERSQHFQEEVRQGGILAVIESENEESQDIAHILREHRARDVEIH